MMMMMMISARPSWLFDVCWRVPEAGSCALGVVDVAAISIQVLHHFLSRQGYDFKPSIWAEDGPDLAWVWSNTKDMAAAAAAGGVRDKETDIRAVCLISDLSEGIRREAGWQVRIRQGLRSLRQLLPITIHVSRHL